MRVFFKHLLFLVLKRILRSRITICMHSKTFLNLVPNDAVAFPDFLNVYDLHRLDNINCVYLLQLFIYYTVYCMFIEYLKLRILWFIRSQ